MNESIIHSIIVRELASAFLPLPQHFRHTLGHPAHLPLVILSVYVVLLLLLLKLLLLLLKKKLAIVVTSIVVDHHLLDRTPAPLTQMPRW